MNKKYLMSEAQKRMFITDQIQDWSVTYNVPIVLEATGIIQVDKILTALHKITENHDILRTSFAYENDKYLQIVKASIDLDFEVVHDMTSIEEEYHKFVRPFDLAEGPLFRFKLFLIDESKSVMMVDFHHIIFDGGSMQPFFEELAELYRGEHVLRSDVQYIHYASWKQNLDLAQQEAFWLEQFPEAPQALDLPLDYPRKSTRSYHGAVVREQLDIETKLAIKALCAEYQTTEYVIMLAALSILLSRYGYQKEFAIGTVVSGRNHPQLENLIGMFVNMLVMKCQIADESSIESYLTEMKKMFLLSLEHQDYPFEKLVEAIGYSDPSRNPLFDTLFVIESNASQMWEFGDVSITQLEMPTTISKFDSMLSAKETDTGYELNWVYCTELFNENTIRQLLSHYKNLLQEMVSDLNAKVGSLNIIDEQEKRVLLKTFNSNQASELQEQTIIELFEKQASTAPNQVAVVFKGEKITYRELNERTNALGQKLRALGVKSNDYVALMAERSIEMIVGIFGILKAGGAYVPLDPTYPKERLTYILNDCQPKAFLTNQKQIEIEGFTVIDLNDELITVTDNLAHVNQPDDLVYTIYTSGTTGKPKGVMIEHRNVLDLVWSQSEAGNYSKDTVVLQNFNYIFDGSVWEIFPALSSGCTLEIIPEDSRYDPEKLLKIIPNKQIMMVPSIFKALVDYVEENDLVKQLHTFDKLYMGGEALPYDLIERYRKMPSSNINHVFNAYGPTETTVYATCHRFDQSHDKMVIGKPIGNTQVHILADNKLCGIGMIGELCVGGDGIARGYLNRPDLTQEKFINNPFGAGRLYRTGDLARWLSDGNIEYLGRIDEQVKIRGFRIELGDIENSLRKVSNIQDAVVTVKAEGDNKFLCGYFIAQKAIDLQVIKNELEQYLPEYMIPTHLIQVADFPKTKSGKLDKKALPEPDDQAREQTIVAPETGAEIAIVEMFKEVLGVKIEIGIDESFFALGGDSIKAIRIVSKLRERGFQVDVKTIMQSKTPRKIGTQIEKIEAISIDQAEVVGQVPLIPVQKDFIENDDEENYHFNQSVLLESQTKLDQNTLKKVLNELMRHHDMLRAVYPDGSQMIKPFKENECFDYTEHDYRELRGEALAKKIEITSHEIQTSINLETGPLVKVGLFLTQEKDYVLLCIHHLVIDGVSWRILMEDLVTGYGQVENGKTMVLPQKTNSFQEWSQALVRYRDSNRLKKELPYWQEVEAKAAIGNLICNEKDSKTLRQRERLAFEIPESQTSELLYDAGQAYQTKLNDLLLTAVVRGISSVTGQTTVALNMEGHGREPIGEEIIIDRTIGWFTSIYPVAMTGVGGNLTDDICNIKETLRKIPNQGLGYGVLKSLGEKVLAGIMPTVTFNYLGEFTSDQEEEKFAMSTLSRGKDVSDTNTFGTDISIDSVVSEGKLHVTISYDASRYDLNLISQLKNEINKELVEILNHCLNVEIPQNTASDFGEIGWSHKEFKKVRQRFTKQSCQIERILPLTGMQEGMLYHKLLNHESSEYVVQTVFKIQEEVSQEWLKQSFDLLMNKHQALRTSIVHEGVSEPRQVILKERPLAYTYIDLLGLEEATERMKKICQEDVSKGFDLEVDSLMRVTLVRICPDDYRLILSFHHITMDGWCTSIILNDFTSFYNQLSEGEALLQLLDELPKEHEYGDYVSYIKSKDIDASLAYWGDLLEGYEGEGMVPSLGTVNQKNQEKVAEIEDYLTVEETGKLEELSKKYSVTLNIILEAAWGMVLQHYNHQQDVVFGKVVSGRNVDLPGIEEMVGLFINTIPVRVESNSEMTFAELVTQLQEQALKSGEHDYCSLADIQKLSMLGSQLVQTTLVFENYFVQEQEDSTSKLNLQLEDSREETNFDLSIMAYKADKLLLKLMYNPNTYGEAEVGNIVEKLKSFLRAIVEKPEACIMALDVISKEEKWLVTSEFNGTAIPYLKEKTAVTLFEEQVQKAPNQIAVVFKEESLTYQELNVKANALGFRLRELGVKPNDYVALMTSRSIDMIVGIYGILKAGGAYVPLDPTYPKERMTYILNDCNPKVLLTNQEHVETALPILEFKDINDVHDENLSHINQPNDLIYTIYTSGTTGNPKGVMVEHRNVLNLVNWKKNYGGYTATSTILQNFNYIFDGSVWEIFPATLSGCTLEIIPEEDRHDPEQLLALLSGKQITMVPSLFKALVDYAEEHDLAPQLHGFDKLYMAGEALPYDLIEKYKKMPGNNIRNVFNAYGPTETTVCATCYQFDQDRDRMLIGKPIGNTEVYILAGDMLCGVGVIGELCVGGDSVARGYLNRPDLTQEKFIANPNGSGRLYRTGDLARFLPDGNIEYLGRIDEQVKIRGFRVELGDIENSLRKIPNINDAVVAVKEQENTKFICGYFIAEKTLDINMIKDELEQQLPDYMLPAYLLQVSEFPKSKSGKLDKKALPIPTVPTNEETYVAPQTKAEIIIVDSFKEVLAIKTDIGIDESFFSLGGDSIKAIRVAAKLKEAGFSIGVKEIMQYRTPRKIGESTEKTKISNLDQSEEIKQVRGETFAAPVALDSRKSAFIFDQINVFPLEEVESQYTASAAQKLYFDMPKATLIFDEFVLDSTLRVRDITQALVQVIRENGILRSSYGKEAGQYTLYEHRLSGTYMPLYFDLRAMPKSTKIALFQTLSDHQRWKSYFEAGTWMSQFVVLRETDETYRIVFAIHHAIWDKMSSLVLEEQVQSVLDGKEVINNLSYAHYIKSLNCELIDEQVQKVNDSFVKLLEAYKNETKNNFITKLEASLIKLPNELYKNYHQLDIWDFLVQIARVIAQENDLLTEKTKEIPMQIVQEGRNKLAADYSQSLGLFADFAPISIGHEVDQQQEPIAHYIRHLDQLKKKHNISWYELFGTHSNNFDSVLLINYLGVYDVNFEQVKQAIINNPDVVGREITITLHDDHLSVIYPVFNNTSNNIQQKLQEKVNAYQPKYN